MPFAAMLYETEICPIAKHSGDGTFAKWRSIASNHAVIRQKLRNRFVTMFPCGVFLKSANDKTRFQFIRFNISRLNIIHISKRRFCQPFATAQFLADSTLNILLQVVRIIFRLTERHLKHKETLRGWFKPKSRKTQRNDFGRVHGVDDAPAVNTIAS